MPAPSPPPAPRTRATSTDAPAATTAPPTPPTPPGVSPTVRVASPPPVPASCAASGSESPKPSSQPAYSTRSIRSPPDASPTALDRGSVQAPGASAHILPSRALSPLQSSTMPLSQSDPPLQPPAPPAPLRPSALLSFLRCAYCRLLLEAPTTLNCGHTVCSKHMTPDGHPLLRTRNPAAGSAHPTRSPVRSGSISIRSTQPVLPPSLPAMSRRRLHTAPTRTRPGARPLERYGSARRCNVRASKRRAERGYRSTTSVARSRVTTATRAQTNAAAGSTSRHHSSTDSDEEDGSDDDEAQSSAPIRYPRLPRSSTPDRAPTNTRSGPSHPNRAPSESPPRPSKRQRTTVPVQTASGLPDRTSTAPTFEKELLSELTCEICYMLLYNPITTPCQHTFCNVLDLPPNSYFYQHAHNEVVVQIIAKAFPELLQERTAIAENDGRDSRLDTAIFVCQLSYPGMPTLLHFFEPRYRLMLRRCLASPTPCFGMVLPRQSANNTEGNDYGTMLQIKSVQMLSDGRSMVETFGTFRFRILERGTLDGYLVGRIERIDDYPPEVEAEIERNAMANPT
ncbi:hypothetical protein FRC07_009490, partial [Ceratobasidium sp. 392]